MVKLVKYGKNWNIIIIYIKLLPTLAKCLTLHCVAKSSEFFFLSLTSSMRSLTTHIVFLLPSRCNRFNPSSRCSLTKTEIFVCLNANSRVQLVLPPVMPLSKRGKFEPIGLLSNRQFVSPLFIGRRVSFVCFCFVYCAIFYTHITQKKNSPGDRLFFYYLLI